MKILISRPDKIGDVVLALHGVKQLKKKLPAAQIYLHTSKVTKPLVELVSFVDGCVSLDEDIKPYKFDASVDLMAKNWTSKIYSEAKIPIRIGNSARWFTYRFNRTHFLRRSRILLNEAEYNWQLMRLLDPSLKNTPLTESLTLDDFSLKLSDVKKINKTILMPGVSISAKAWDQSNWIELAASLGKENKLVTILLGPEERNQAESYQSALADLNSIEIQVIEDFPRLLKLLASATTFVGPSTGVTHLASALGLSGAAIYSEIRSMHPRRWQPFRSNFTLLSLSSGLTATDVKASITDQVASNKKPLMRSQVSGFVICCNEENKIRRCLNSLSWCDEIIVVDSGSTDNTLSICKEYTSNIYHRDWTGHREQKQFALGKCTKDWVVNIDADEEISMELKAKLEQTLTQDFQGKCDANGFTISRIVYFLNRWWDKGGWYPEYRLRFFKRAYTNWGGIDPHEKAEVTGKIRKISDPIYHFTYDDIQHQLSSTNSHSTLSAVRLHEMGVKSNLFKILLHPPVRFIKFYILKLGFRHGVAGLIVASIDASSTFLKYSKLWELQQKSPDTKQSLTSIIPNSSTNQTMEEPQLKVINSSKQI
ncbi:MAG: glycosyltransferase [Bdellovibrionota bacterium]